MVETRDTCVYAHFRASDGLMFYIGIGTEQRPYEVGRNAYWGNVVAKHGYTVEVLLSDLTWEEACTVEVEMIAAFRSVLMQSKAKLTNQTDGGDGTKGYRFTKEQIVGHTAAIRAACASPEWRRKAIEAGKKRVANPEWAAKTAEAGRRAASDPEWRKKVSAAAGKATDKRVSNPEWLPRIRMASALRYATAHSRLNPQFYPWLYKWKDGKVYAK